MLSSCSVRRCLMRLALASATELADASAAERDRQGQQPLLWFDDTAAALEAHQQHIESPEYKELHRPALTNSSMGLFGGEPGFEKAHRVWVDPDRPQMKHIYNQTALARNLRYARYGYFKRDMHLLDIDKLVRHARMLPTPNRLLNDFLYQRVPLPDASCAALIRYQRDQLEMLDEWRRPASLHCAEEMFEQMAVTNMPPVDVGVETHTEMIRCCAVCKDWHRGWDVYLNRAREVEQEMDGDGFLLDTNLFDSVLQLCVETQRPQEGMQIMEEAIARKLRARPNMLEKVMVLASLGVEQQVASRTRDSRAGSLDTEGGAAAAAAAEKEEVGVNYAQYGLDAWALFDFYEVPRSTNTIEAYLRLCGMLQRPELALDAVRQADSGGIHLSLECYYWLLYAVRGLPDFGDYIVDVFAQLKPRGLSADYVLFTIAFMYCALHKDAELALALYAQQWIHLDMNPTPEIVLLFTQACASCEAPHVDMLQYCDTLIDRLESIGSSEDRISDIYDQYIELCAHVGAIGSGFSKIKKLVGFGKPLTTRQLNSLLLANANAAAPNGGVFMTEEVMSLFRHLRITPNDDTIICLALCVESHGNSASTDTWREGLTRIQQSSSNQSLGKDGDIAVSQDPPHRLRLLRTAWNIKPRDIMLRRFGQHSKMPGKEQTGSMLGSVVPFGRSPGERDV